MEQIITVPTDELGILDAHFGHCKFFEIMKVVDKVIASKEIVTPPPHEPGLLPKWLSEKGVTDIISGGMGNKAIQIFNKNGVNAFVGAPKLPAEELLTQFLANALNLTENACTH